MKFVRELNLRIEGVGTLCLNYLYSYSLLWKLFPNIAFIVNISRNLLELTLNVYRITSVQELTQHTIRIKCQ